jgi:hypothetical protein
MDTKEILEKYKTIAVVGCSANPSKPAHIVPKYLQEHGYKIIPINPTVEEILGVRAYKSLADVKEPIDIVSIFRPGEEALEVVKQSIGRARVVWMQEGIINEEAAELGRKNGLIVVMDRCMKKEHQMHFGE